jgi:hypothetical protein
LVTPPTEFSTWTASLAGAFFHAIKLVNEGAEAVHVTVIDTNRLDGGALVWYAPDLLGDTCSVYEYLAHGPVRGAGFQTASWENLLKAHLDKFFDELVAPTPETYGQDRRASIFEKPPAKIEGPEIPAARKIAALFGELEVPVTLILLSMRPRLVNHSSGREKFGYIEELFAPDRLGKKEDIAQGVDESWLNMSSNVFVDSSSKDIEEWMQLLYTLASVIKLDIVENRPLGS